MVLGFSADFFLLCSCAYIAFVLHSIITILNIMLHILIARVVSKLLGQSSYLCEVQCLHCLNSRWSVKPLKKVLHHLLMSLISLYLKIFYEW